MDVLTVNRTYKSRIFAMLFSDRNELLKLYNAINGTSYDDPDLLQINILENAVYMSMQNDVSFIIELGLNLYEHQSTYSPNLPVRYLLYVADVYSDYTKDMNLYGTKAVKLPLDEAVERAITECISEGILADFLRKNRAEAKKVSIYEYDEERHMRQTREEGVEEGYAKGLACGISRGIDQGINQGIEQTAINLIKARILTDEQIKEVTGLSQTQLDKIKKIYNP